MSDIFDLEQQIMDCWHIVDGIKILEEAVLDKEQSHNDTGNVLIGLEYLYQLKFEKLFATFENHCKEYHQYRKFYEMNQAPEIDILDSRIAKRDKEMTKDEAMKLALEALECALSDHRPYIVQCKEAITAIKEALAQSEQEPVAWLITDEKINSLQVDSIQRLIDRARHANMTDIKLRINGQDEWYQADWLKHLIRATPPQRTWVGLTDEEFIAAIDEGFNFALDHGNVSDRSVIRYARAIEAKLREKNT